MRRAAATDANQAEIVAGLRQAGCSVHTAHAMGEGFPDLVVGLRGVTKLIEVKDGRKPPSARKLTTVQQEWHDAWRGHVAVAESLDDALKIMGVI